MLNLGEQTVRDYIRAFISTYPRQSRGRKNRQDCHENGEVSRLNRATGVKKSVHFLAILPLEYQQP
jgi:hypothetical protein